MRELQRTLVAAGFNPGPIDGEFGPVTGAAVRAFQQFSGLLVDGVVGPNTWAALAHVSHRPLRATLSLRALQIIMPQLNAQRAEACLVHLLLAMKEAKVEGRLRVAAFIAQLAHESGELRFFEELASGAAYEGRKRLGNTQPGDGSRYKGRGPIQLTGRANYRAAGRALGLDLESHPERAATLDVGFRIAGWYWTSRDLNPLADAGQFEEITRRINGGTNGLAARLRYYRRALAVL